MSPEDRAAITTSIANLWTFNALFISRLLETLRNEGLPADKIEHLLQILDRDTDEILDGVDDQAYAAGLLASVRALLARE
jgi:hypothetical protein